MSSDTFPFCGLYPFSFFPAVFLSFYKSRSSLFRCYISICINYRQQLGPVRLLVPNVGRLRRLPPSAAHPRPGLLLRRVRAGPGAGGHRRYGQRPRPSPAGRRAGLRGKGPAFGRRADLRGAGGGGGLLARGGRGALPAAGGGGHLRQPPGGLRGRRGIDGRFQDGGGVD